ncbi:hypothetical protein Tco_0145373 [Tanacetum coccineum]
MYVEVIWIDVPLNQYNAEFTQERIGPPSAHRFPNLKMDLAAESVLRLHKWSTYDSFLSSERRLHVLNSTSSSANNDTQAECSDIRLSNDIKPLHEVQSTVAYNEDADDRQHVEQPKFINEGKVDQDAEQCLENKTTRVHKENLRATLSEFSVNHLCGKEDSSPSSTNELEKESGENTCDNAKF